MPTLSPSCLPFEVRGGSGEGGCRGGGSDRAGEASRALNSAESPAQSLLTPNDRLGVGYRYRNRVSYDTDETK